MSVSGQTWRLLAAQYGMWFAQSLSPENPEFNISEYMEIHGSVDPELFAAAHGQAGMEAQACRLRFLAGDDGPVQLLDPELSWPLWYFDVSGTPDPMAETRRWAEEDLTRVVDLHNGPLCTAALFKLAEDRFILYRRVHHIVIDGWSLALLGRRTAEVYNALLSGRAVPDRWFGSFASLLDSESAYRRSKAFERDRRYWTERLHDFGAPATLAMRQRPGSRGFMRHAKEFGIERYTTLAALADRLGASVAELLIIAMAVYVAGMANRDEVVLGIPVTGRVSREERYAPGMVANILPLRLAVGRATSLAKFTRQVRAEMRRAMVHSRYRVEDIARDLGLVGRDQALYGPIVNVMTFDHDIRFDGHATTLRSASRLSVDDLVLGFYQTGGSAEIDVLLDANPALYQPDEVAAHLNRFLTFVDTMAGSEPELPIGDLALLDGSELATVLAWSQGPAREIPATTLSELLNQQTKRTPDRVALVFEDTELTYADLDDRVRRLARTLVACGAGPEKLVAVALPRSVDLVVTLLAALRSGAAYLPIETGYPVDRIRFMLVDARPELVVTTATTAESLPTDIPVLTLDAPEFPAEPRAWPLAVRAARPGNLAYVIYTSGSTGQPKGVLVTHTAIVNRLLWMQDTFGLTGDDRVLQKTPIGFDVSVWEIFWPLISGATLVVAAPNAHRDTRYLAELIRRRQITTVHFVPSMLAAFLDEPLAAGCAGMRRVICSGEALPTELRARFTELLDVPLFNLYGPTEAAVDVTWTECSRQATPEPVPIGRPVCNTRTYVLDAGLRPVPVGATGELYLGGVQLAQGYLARPVLTAEHFIPDPWGPRGSRMYRTGDLTRWNTVGELVFLGRADNQVKIRGMRIEPGEISAVLSRHPGVGRVAVLAKPTPRCEQQLVAYVVPDAERAPAVLRLAELRQAGALDDLPWHDLPNGMSVVGRNRAEIEFLYQEVFADEEYLRHGVTLDENAVVFDIGAHIGMFTLFAASRAPGVSVHAVEPIPDLFRQLKINISVHGVRAVLHNCGVAEKAGAAIFTYYPQLSILSGRFADEAAERRSVAAFVSHDNATGAAVDPLLDELLSAKLRREQVTCRLLTISELIDETGVNRIDLLKVDAEKSELSVLRGVRAEHWPLIWQVVAEVHLVSDQLANVTELLRDNGFAVTVEASGRLAESGLTNVFAVRAGRPRPDAHSGGEVGLTDRRWFGSAGLVADLRRHAREALPEQMVPGSFVILDALPVTANGKLDCDSLPAPEAPTGVGRSPKDDVERQLCQLFAEILGVPTPSVDDSFFELGGHSLLATRLIGAIRARLGVNVEFQSIFDAPTVISLSEHVRTTASRSVDDAVDDDPLVTLRVGASAPLFCVHPASGHVSAYLDLIRHLPAELTVYGLQARHRADGRLAANSVEELAADYADRIRSCQPVGPYRLLGWSFGGLLAHAIATQLRAAGAEVSLLALLDCYPPTETYTPQPMDEQESLRALLGFFGRKTAHADVGPLTVRRVVQILSGPTVEAIALTEQSVIALAARIRHATELAAGFLPGRFSGDVIYFAASRGRADTAPTALAWQKFVDGRIERHDLDCRHFDMMRYGPAKLIAEKLSKVFGVA